ncbi:hypothetical protein [Rhizobium sp. BK376]|uniref:hypothetical protein n=1 Tax=Rhizobium sp. BK376 TaxID=2512149 RepID=UPI00104CC791|nr:hypothetical protein [Rhizobium sp. BK376]TCR83472.1 hypothetical protein EV561_1091 [Rhizobium sp. BK376]
MGLDLVVEGCAKAGCESEWRRLVEKAFSTSKDPAPPLSDAENARFNEISIAGYKRIGAPCVGSDPAADAWILEARQASTAEEIAQTLKEFDGYHVLRLLKCDGVPIYSNGGMYDGVDETSFRGAFLETCRSVIDHELLQAAWEHKLPETAIDYGKALLTAADAAEKTPLQVRGGFLSRIGLRKSAAPLPLSEQLDIVRAAGRWFVFWGERGHPIRAYF